MKTYNPSVLSNRVDNETRIWMQSVHKTLNSGVDMGVPALNGSQSKDGTVNAGVYTQFDRGNSSGVLIRVAASGLTGTGASYNWPTSIAQSVVITHGLGRQPIGFYVVDKDGPIDVYRTAP